MKQEKIYENALHKAAAYCSASEKCEYDVREKLLSWGISIADTDKIITKLVAENFLDEKRFAQFFVRDKFRFNKWGKIKIAYALKQKQINPEFIQESLDSIDNEEYQSLLTELLQSKIKGLKYKDKYDMQAKIYRFAQGRGFETSIVSLVFSKISAESFSE